MKIYSDTLVRKDFEQAVQLVAGLGLEEFEQLPRVRKRAEGWQVLLYRRGSNRPFNSGQFGGSDRENGRGYGAASRADWGWFLAALYERDPDMAAGPYNSADDFHSQTNGLFRFQRLTPVITIEQLREWVNTRLATPNSSLWMKAPGKDRDMTPAEAFRMGAASLLESALHAAARYRGFAYQDGQVTWPDGPDGSPDITDETRRIYY